VNEGARATSKDSPQEAFWQGTFGYEYSSRNQGQQLVQSNFRFFRKSLRKATGIETCIEFGANIGLNLQALQLLNPAWKFHGVEINEFAAGQLANLIGIESVFATSIANFDVRRTWDLVLIKGVLIHIAPEQLNEVYDRLFAATGRYLLLAEYYNPTPVSIPYRGYQDRLFKRDFAGELLDRFSELNLLDYGFAYHRDPVAPQDDLNWFLLQKR
jgi:spore coat polysaccharide biosynthesis protein SpsF